MEYILANKYYSSLLSSNSSSLQTKTLLKLSFYDKSFTIKDAKTIKLQPCNCSRVFPLVSGTYNHANSKANTPRKANPKNVVDIPKLSTTIGKKRPMEKLTIQSTNVVMPIPNPRNFSGNIDLKIKVGR